ncbi:MAG: 2-aminoethylphosphonate--pyruvate transaminase [Anaerolineae bacterium]|nr:2-aminoethylphosphonate--pyruvate transaminase [Anaerolineae bacterium]MDW8100039.1 2-aminoethylphosphonate--pyruvate transaminase [Anaerolineae bacterium]
MIASWKDKALFTPGPLTTSRTVKQAMLRDLGSRDAAFIAIVREVRQRLIELGGVDENEFTAVLMQGSGTFGLEAVVSSVIPPTGKLLVLINGAYGERILKIAEIHRIPTLPLRCAEDTVPDVEALDAALAANPAITHVAVVHCETTTGIINPIDVYGDVVRRYRRSYIVDAMSSFGAYPIQLDKWGIDFLVSSSNKCIEGVPGFSFVLARKAALLAARGFARTLSLDLLAQWEGLEKDGQFRFTPPTHAILAFEQALRELEAEGGVEARAQRYRRNYEITLAAMQEMGFEPYLPPEYRGYIITAFRYPDHPRFDFREFYERLSNKGHIIYPGKLSHADCFRIGHIGRIEESDVYALMAAIKTTLAEMDIHLV